MPEAEAYVTREREPEPSLSWSRAELGRICVGRN